MGLAVGLAKVDLIDFEQGKITLSVLGRPNLSGDAVTGTKVEPPYLTG